MLKVLVVSIVMGACQAAFAAGDAAHDKTSLDALFDGNVARRNRVAVKALASLQETVSAPALPNPPRTRSIAATDTGSARKALIAHLMRLSENEKNLMKELKTVKNTPRGTVNTLIAVVAGAALVVGIGTGNPPAFWVGTALLLYEVEKLGPKVSQINQLEEKIKTVREKKALIEEMLKERV